MKTSNDRIGDNYWLKLSMKSAKGKPRLVTHECLPLQDKVSAKVSAIGDVKTDAENTTETATGRTERQ